MTQEGSVAVDGEEVVDGRPRRYFRLTPDGAERLRREVDRLEANAAKARERLIARPALSIAFGL